MTGETWLDEHFNCPVSLPYQWFRGFNSPLGPIKLFTLYTKPADLSTNTAIFRGYVWLGKEITYICIRIWQY
jgi:hypothetical protein